MEVEGFHINPEDIPPPVQNELHSDGPGYRCYMDAEYFQFCHYAVLCTDGEKIYASGPTDVEDNKVNVMTVDGWEFIEPPPVKYFPVNQKSDIEFWPIEKFYNHKLPITWTNGSMWITKPESNVKHPFVWGMSMSSLYTVQQRNDSYNLHLPPMDHIIVDMDMSDAIPWMSGFLRLAAQEQTEILSMNQVKTQYNIKPGNYFCSNRGGVTGYSPKFFGGKNDCDSFRKKAWEFAKLPMDYRHRSPPPTVLIINRPNSRGFGKENLEAMKTMLLKYISVVRVVELNEEKSFVGQIDLLANTGLIIGGHGAGLSNMIFQGRLSSIIEIFPWNFNRNTYRSIAGECGLLYYALMTKNVLNPPKDFPEKCYTQSARKNNEDLCNMYIKNLMLEAPIDELERLFLRAMNAMGYPFPFEPQTPEQMTELKKTDLFQKTVTAGSPQVMGKIWPFEDTRTPEETNFYGWSK